MKRRVWHIVWWAWVAFVAAGTIAASFGGVVNPRVTTIFALMAMTLPAWLILSLVNLAIGLFTVRRSIVLTIVALLVSIGPILQYCPLHLSALKTPTSFTERADSIGQHTFTLMSYNVMNFFTLTNSEESAANTHPEERPKYNATLSYIIKENPDVACLVECEYMSEYLRSGVMQAQVDTINERYYYRVIDRKGNSVFSKYPIDSLAIDGYSLDELPGFAGYKLTVDSVDIALIVVHMTSLGLSDEDKHLYNNLTQLKGVRNVGRVKESLLSKLSAAMRRRAVMADNIRDYIERLGMDNVIVVGDFNDIPSCYAVRQLESIGLKDVYAQVGFGPMITYYGDRFYFRIDQAFYRGCMRPLWMSRGHLRTSDHYPLLMEFETIKS